jgi:Protein of unknown function (DUF3617)
MKHMPWMLLTALLLSTASAAWAQKIAPGLWENTTTMKQQGTDADERMAKMQAELAKMPPAQRKMMEDMMAKHGAAGGGNVMDLMTGKPTTMRLCVTPEQAARDFAPMHDGKCKTDSVERSGKTVRAKFSCTGESASNGESEYTLVSDKAYTGRVTVNTTRNGQAARMDMSSAGRWLAADCGAVKPLSDLLPPNANNAAPGAKP